MDRETGRNRTKRYHAAPHCGTKNEPRFRRAGLWPAPPSAICAVPAHPAHSLASFLTYALITPTLPSTMSALPAAPPATVTSRLLRAADLPRRGASLRPADRLPTGIVPFDTLLGGGLPRGALVELSGHTGRFALVLAALAAATSRGETAALLDLGDHLDPAAAEEAGCDLARLLWVRPRRFRDALLAAETVAAAGFRLVVLDAGLALPSSRLRDAGPWLRLARAAAPRRVAFLLSTPVPLAGLAAEALVGVSARALFHRAGAVRFLAGAATSLSLLKIRGDRPAEAPLLALSPLAAPLARRLLPDLLPAAPVPTRVGAAPSLAPTRSTAARPAFLATASPPSADRIPSDRAAACA